MTAKSKLEMGEKFPYDDFPDDDSAMPSPAVDWAHAAARGVLADLEGRRGVGQELEQVDDETRVELVQSVAEIIRLAHQTKS
ncbi:hypothetical protein ACLPJG_26655 [Pseudomonas aeruginosa]|jgi:hypothetical protein|uniref:Uncharacterized protein n=3 Tax=Pseudomonas TaxID=286 RepID=A0A3M4KB31_9PSED|nr:MULTISPECIES: hypothetical protein [Pseudomonas]RFP99717.1 hypothetical protein D0O09_21135 [Pseudomonas putida]MDH0760458.1 hypothetical protein [Pseudomonas juntendi]MDH1917912.1 hypothetical protein [Pseudomonas juntendi]MDM3951083.1 hypothetical protein [Pseudomonas alloputida]RMQ26274.1 hypothetical protein ALQ08_01437 [Pseudomonas syringae pv. delphinii]